MTDVQGVRRLASKLVKYDERLLALEAAPQMGHSSVSIGGEDYVVPDLLGVLRDNDREVAEAMSGVAADLAAANEEIAQARDEVAAIGDVSEAAKVLADAAKDAALEAQASADGKTKVFYQASEPSSDGRTVGDTWFDSDDGNRIYRWSGTAWVAAELGTGAIADAVITNAKISNLDAAKITTGTLAADRIGALSITTEKLAAGAVSAEKILALAVTADKLAANAVTADKIVANAITGDKIAANSITAAKIAANAITATQIAGGAIDGMVITGSTLRTASSGARIEMFLNVTDIGSWPMLAMFGPDTPNPLASLNLGGEAGQDQPNLTMYDGSGAVQAALTNRGLLLANDGEITLRAGRGTLNDAIAGERYGRIYRPFTSGGVQIDGGSDSAGFASLRMDYLSDGGRINLIGIYGRTTTNSANMFIATAGNIARSTSLKRAKVDVQDQDSDLALLSVPFRSWVDRQNMVDVVLGRRADPGPRVVGVVAEELERVAPELCVYGDDGALQGVAYDRIGPALIPIIRTLVNRVEQLEGAPVTAWTDSPVYDDTELLDEITAYGAEAPEEVAADAVV